MSVISELSSSRRKDRASRSALTMPRQRAKRDDTAGRV